MKLKFTITFLVLITLFIKVSAQSSKIIDNDSLLLFYLHQNPSGIDTNADAIEIVRNEKMEILNQSGTDLKSLNIYQERCFKILSQDALRLAEFAIRTDGKLRSKAFNIYVCYLENGILIKQKITKSDAIKETVVRGINMFKFNISELKVGRILYYSFKSDYQIMLNHYRTVPVSFDFETQFPVVKASFVFTIPSTFTYKCIPQNITFDTINVTPKTEIIQNTCMVNISKDYETTTWTTYNLDKIKEEPFVKDMDSKKKSVKILVDACAFDTLSKNIVAKTFLHKTWQENLPKSAYRFLLPQEIIIPKYDSLCIIPVLNRVDSFRNKAFKNFEDSLNYTKAVYYFVRDSIKTVYNDRGITNTNNIYQTLKDRKGTVTDKNDLLTYLYQRMGLSGRNIILSTNEKIDLNSYDPTIFNYMISAVTLGSQYFMLDPGYKFLPFGALAPKCYNGIGFVLNKECVALDISPESYKDKINISYTIAPKDPANNYELKIEERYGEESGAVERAFINSDTSENRNYFKDKINQLKYNIKLNDFNIINEKQVDSQLIIKYNLNLSLENSNQFSYFNPFMRKIQSVNPFKDLERKYPIEFDISPDINYQLKIKFPNNIKLEEYPESKNIKFKNDKVTYSQTITFDETKNTLFVTYSFKMREYEFPASDYKEIRNFFDQVISEQAKQIVLKDTN